MTESAIPVNIYHYERLIGDWPTRFHLRVDPDGGGMLLANAAEAAYLSPVGVLMTRGVLEGRSDAAIKQDIRGSFRRAAAATVDADLASIHQLITNLSEPGDNYPITNLADPRVAEWSRELAAPLRADVVPADLDTTKEVLLRLWEAGIPHATILAQPQSAKPVGGPSPARLSPASATEGASAGGRGENAAPTDISSSVGGLSPARLESGHGSASSPRGGCPSYGVEGDAKDLALVMEAAGDIGMITGLRAVASWLSTELIEQAAMAGLDHLDLLYVSATAQAHDEIAGQGDYERVLAAFGQCVELELCPVAQIPLIESNTEELEEMMAALQERGISNLVFFALACPDDDDQAQAAGALPARALPQVATIMIEAAEDTEARYLWAPPVRFDNNKSLAEQVRAGPRTAGDVAIRVAADGRVFAPRGGRDCAGNLLTQPWADIWNHECFTRYRERLQAPTRCSDCPDLEICVADCPKDPRGWSDDTQGGEDQ